MGEERACFVGLGVLILIDHNQSVIIVHMRPIGQCINAELPHSQKWPAHYNLNLSFFLFFFFWAGIDTQTVNCRYILSYDAITNEKIKLRKQSLICICLKFFPQLNIGRDFYPF